MKRLSNIVLAISISLLMMTVTAFAETGDGSPMGNGGPQKAKASCKSYCYGYKSLDHKIAHNTLISGSGDSTAAAKKDHNRNMKAHKASMPDSTHNGQYF